MAALQQHSSVKGGLQPTVAFFDWFHLDETLLRDYARANASIGINGSVLNNVNASPKMLTKPYLQEVQKIARILQTKNGPLDFQPREPYSPVFDQISNTPNMVELQIISQANWYAFGRLAWNPRLSSEQIAREWLEQTFTSDTTFVRTMSRVMTQSREACVDYMMPLGLHHIFKFDHHYGPEPDGFKADYPLEWCPVYYHQADKNGVGFNRTHT